MSPTITISIFSIFIILLPISSIMSDDTPPPPPPPPPTPPTVYEAIQEYDFPVGLLPQGVSSYELDKTTGKFSVYFPSSCSFTIESYNLKYKSTITGTISKDKLTNLSGVQVKILFFWLDIVEVVKDGDDLEFSVGIVSADFPVDNFYESPQCGCGFNCGNNLRGCNGGKISLRNFVSSI